MKTKYKAAIFDLDGTLLDTSPGILQAVDETIRLQGLRQLTPAELKTFIGPPCKASFKEKYGLDDQRAGELSDFYRDLYKEPERLTQATPYPGVFDLLHRLKDAGIRLSVATYKREDCAVNLLKHFGFDAYFSYIYGSDPESTLTKPEIIQKCLRDMGVTDYAEAVMVGDSFFDALGAKDLGIDFLGLTCGFGFQTEADIQEYPNVGWGHLPMDLLPCFFKDNA